MGASSTSTQYNKQAVVRVNRQSNGGHSSHSSHHSHNSHHSGYSNQIPDSRMYEYDKAVKDFMAQQEFKKLARENNLNINGKFIKWRIWIDIKSIKLTQDEESKNLYWLSWTYSSKEKWKITVYYWATQTSNREGLPMYFLIPPTLPSAASCEVDKGINSKFEGVDKVWFDVESYSEMPLFNCTQNYYPCIITIEPAAKPKVGEDGISDHQNLITYWTFTTNKEENVLNLKPIKQVLVAYEMGFNLQQIYGITDALEERKGESIGMLAGVDYQDSDAANQWVICISEEKNTIVMPCGHLWVCKDWAIAMSKQPKPDWPVWRKKVKSFVPINITSIKKLETFDQTFKGEKSFKGSKISDDVNEGAQL